MQFRLLGPVEIEDGDRSLALGSGKQRALLAILLLHRNELVSLAQRRLRYTARTRMLLTSLAAA